MRSGIAKICLTLWKPACQPHWRSFQTMAKHKGPKKPPPQKKPPLTHFLCVPLVNPTSRAQLEASLSRFQDDVAPASNKVSSEMENSREAEKDTPLPAIHPKAIRPLGSLHCTLGVMSLDSNQLSEAIECLKSDDVRNLLKNMSGASSTSIEATAQSQSTTDSSSLDRSVTPPKLGRTSGPLKVHMKGLEPMQSPQNTSILYTAPVDDTGRLYPFCVALQTLFKDRGFLVEDNRQLKLHVTVVNTIYTQGRKRPVRSGAKTHGPGQSADRSGTIESGEGSSAQPESLTGDGDRSRGHGPNVNAPLKIDARALLERYKDFVWADEVVLDRIAICEMGAKKVTDAEGKEVGAEYTEVATISLTAE